MWILTKPLSASYTLMAPRAPVQTGPDQYSWHEINPNWPDIDTYRQLSMQLMTRVDKWISDHQLNIKQIDVMGFSQGAVMAYAMAILNPDYVRKVAALSGFIPSAWREQLQQKTLQNQQFYIAHGTDDDVIPIKKAHQATQLLREAGTQVRFCEAKTGHKLSANCYKSLGEFFSTSADQRDRPKENT